jgi:hypothetical protein
MGEERASSAMHQEDVGLPGSLGKHRKMAFAKTSNFERAGSLLSVQVSGDQGQKSVRLERFRQIRIEAGGDSLESVILPAPPRRSDEKEMLAPGLVANYLCNLEAIKSGHSDVEQNDGRFEFPGQLESARAIVSHEDLVAIDFQQRGQIQGRVVIVVRDQNSLATLFNIHGRVRQTSFASPRVAGEALLANRELAARAQAVAGAFDMPPLQLDQSVDK